MSTSISLAESLRERVGPFVPLKDEQIRQFESHFTLLLRWNRRLNLTTITDPAEAATRHYGESAFLASFLSGSVVDVGSGAGFPGIPAAIMRPDCRFDLVESHQRKAVFLREASRELKNVRVLSDRAESIPGRYDWVISRAVAPDEILRLELAPSVALLAGLVDIADRPGFEVRLLPWGDNRVLALRRGAGIVM